MAVPRVGKARCEFQSSPLTQVPRKGCAPADAAITNTVLRPCSCSWKQHGGHAVWVHTSFTDLLWPKAARALGLFRLPILSASHAGARMGEGSSAMHPLGYVHWFDHRAARDGESGAHLLGVQRDGDGVESVGPSTEGPFSMTTLSIRAAGHTARARAPSTSKRCSREIGGTTSGFSGCYEYMESR
jgi:hypothetical protein